MMSISTLQDSVPAMVLPAAEKLCRVCQKAMPAQGKKCTACGSFQDWRHGLSFSTEFLAMLIALLSVFGIAVPAFTRWLDRHSHTQVRIVGASDDDLLVIVMNTGREPSTAFAFRAMFRNVPLRGTRLLPVDPGEFLIPAEGSRMVHLRPLRFTAKPGSNIAVVNAALRSGILKLRADIKESTDEKPAEITFRSTEYPTSYISPWIKNYIPVNE